MKRILIIKENKLIRLNDLYFKFVGFLKNTTRILVTHQLQYLMNTNKLAILHEVIFK